MNAQALDEFHYGEVDVVLLCIEDARRRAERAERALRESGAEDFLVEALGRAQEDLLGGGQEAHAGDVLRGTQGAAEPLKALCRSPARRSRATSKAYGSAAAAAHDPAESNRRLLELNRDIAAGRVAYDPFS